MSPPEDFATWLHHRMNQKVYTFEEPKGILGMTEPNEELEARLARKLAEENAAIDAAAALTQEALRKQQAGES